MKTVVIIGEHDARNFQAGPGRYDHRAAGQFGPGQAAGGTEHPNIASKC